MAMGSQWQDAVTSFWAACACGVSQTIKGYSSIITCCSQGRRWILALHLLKRSCSRARYVPVPELICCNAAMSSGEKSSRWHMVSQLFSEMEEVFGIQPDVISSNVAISSLEKGLQWQRSLCVFSTLLSVSPDVITFNAWVKGRLPSAPSNVIIFSATLSSFEKVSEWRKAVELSSATVSRRIQADAGHIWFENTWGGALISSFPDWQRILQLLELMEDESLQPDVVTYSALISACEEALQWQMLGAIGGFEIFFSQMAMHFFSTMQLQRIPPNVISYSAAMGSWARLLSAGLPMDVSTALLENHGSIAERRRDRAAKNNSTGWCIAFHETFFGSFEIKGLDFNTHLQRGGQSPPFLCFMAFACCPLAEQRLSPRHSDVVTLGCHFGV
eukprot:s5_g73.t1